MPPQRTVPKTVTIPHYTLCKRVSRCFNGRQCSVVNLPVMKLPDYGVKVVNIQLHCRGCGGNLKQRHATLTAVVQFPEKSSVCQELLDFYDCKVKLKVDVYRGHVEQGDKICTQFVDKKLSSVERQCRKMQLVVNDVIHLDEIVYPEVRIDIISIQITACLQARKIEVNVLDSGCHDFVNISTSIESYLP